MIGVMYAALSVGGTHPLAIEMLISLVMYGEMSFAQSFISQVGHGSRSDCFDGASAMSFLTLTLVLIHILILITKAKIDTDTDSELFCKKTINTD